MKKVTNKALLALISDLEDRVQELEHVTDSQSSHVSLFREIIEIFRELPIGRAFINRALNRVKLRYLKNVVLPRRQAQIEILKNEKMPSGVKELLINDAILLLEKAKHDADHRLFFEKQSSYKVRSIFETLQKMFTKKHAQIHHNKL